MWTERERYITSFEEIKSYIEQIGFFHDHRVGNVEYDGKVAKITVEEIVPDKHISESVGNIWDFTITGIESYQMNCDCAFTWFLNEITLEDGELVFNFTNGYVSIKAKEIRLGIPSQQADKSEFISEMIFLNKDILLSNIEKIHTTEMGIDRINKNLKLDTNDVVEFCKNKILDKNCNINKQGKNWYCEIDNIKITINSYSYTIITAHLIK